MNKTTAFLLILSITCAFANQHVEENNAADELVRDIQQRENEVRNEQSAHWALWEPQSVECVETIGFRSQEIADAVTALANSQVAQATCENALSASEADKAKAEGYAATINDILNNLQVQRESSNTYFLHVVNEELNPAIEAINGVFPLLAEFSQSQDSFVQLTNHLNKSFIQMVKAKKAVQFGTVFAQLLSAQTVGVSEETIEQLSKLFDDLLEDLSNEKASRIEQENAEVEAYNTAVAGYNAILDSLANTVATLEAYIVELNTCIQTESAVSASAEAKRVRNQDALDAAVELCDSRQTAYNNQTAARDQQLVLFGKLKSFVREQEDIFGNFGTDGVNAFEEYQKSFAEIRHESRTNFLQLSLKKFQNKSYKSAVAPAKCDNCRKAFVQKKLGF